MDHRVLKRFYTQIKPLSIYIQHILNVTEGEIIISTDSDEYRQLLNDTMVASKIATPPSMKRQSTSLSMNEVIDAAMRKAFTGLKKPNTMITLGYTKGDYSGKAGRDNIANVYPNALNSLLRRTEWITLLQRIGPDLMTHLLLEVSLYTAAAPNQQGCLVQVTGQPLHTLKRLDAAYDPLATKLLGKRKKPRNQVLREADLVRKRPRLEEESPALPPLYTGLKDVVIPRATTFYGRPSNTREGKIRLGLSPRHHLNNHRIHLDHAPKSALPKFSTSASTKAPPSHPILLEQEEKPPMKRSKTTMEIKNEGEILHIAKRIFPRQFGLPSVFDPLPTDTLLTLAEKEKLRKGRDEKQKEIAIKLKGSVKTPKRIKPLLPLVQDLMQRHSLCEYEAWVGRICPSKIKTNKPDDAVILELMTETSHQSSKNNPDISIEVSQASLVIPHGASQAREAVTAKPVLRDFTVPYWQVTRYLEKVSNEVIPKSFWGCEKNWKTIKQYIRTLVYSHRFESLTLHHVLQNFVLSECEWLIPPGSLSTPASRGRITVTDAIKRRELLEEFLDWYFRDFLCQLLKTTFYITESGVQKHHMFYFRQDDWHALCKPLIERLTETTFRKIEIDPRAMNEILSYRTLGYSTLRLLPKETGARPIVNLRRKNTQLLQPNHDAIDGQKVLPGIPEATGGRDSALSINQVLKVALEILSYERDQKPELMGAATIDIPSTYTKLKTFKKRMLNKGKGVIPKLYFIKMDVKACYDTIEQNKLLEIITEILQHPRYTVRRHVQHSTVGDEPVKSFRRHARPDGEPFHFMEYARRLASSLRHTIFVDQVSYQGSESEEIIQLLNEHIKENVVKINNEYFIQTVGIPQGSIVSSLLCSFFYGDLESKKLKIQADPNCLLLRWVDDYLMITDDRQKANQFLGVMNQGHPEYGCFIAQEKTITNFHSHLDVMTTIVPQDRQFFPWCSFNIDMKTLEVMKDYSRQQNHIADGVTVSRGKHAGAIFTRRVGHASKMIAQALFIDTELNSTRVVHLNIYQNFLLTAMKMHTYLNDFSIQPYPRHSYILDTINQAIHSTYMIIKAKLTSPLAKNAGARFSVRLTNFTWLALHAFYTVLSRKPTTHAKLLQALGFLMRLPKYQVARTSFRKLVEEGFQGLDHISF